MARPVLNQGQNQHFSTASFQFAIKHTLSPYMWRCYTYRSARSFVKTFSLPPRFSRTNVGTTTLSWMGSFQDWISRFPGRKEFPAMEPSGIDVCTRTV